jgi:Kef-type K+ transport system membrane component KefB
MRSKTALLVGLPFLLGPSAAHAGGGAVEEGLSLVSAIGVAIVAGCVLMTLFSKLRLPALLAYIVSGILLGTFAGELLRPSMHDMEHISHLGLVFLLFIIGLEMDLRGILRLGPRAAVAVLLQAPIAIGTVLGIQFAAEAMGIAIPGLGTDRGSYIYFATACALGSTAVVVKLLGEKLDLGSKAGKVTVLTLIAEDIWAVLALSYVSTQSGVGGSSMVVMILGGAAAAAALVLFARFALSRVMAWFAKSPDLMAFVALGWCFSCAEVMALVGLSAEMGALIAGITIGALPHHVEVLAKVSPLRDFFMALFFVSLGMSLPPPTLSVMGQAAMLALFAILARLLLYTPTLLAARLGPVVSLAVPINLAQISEFTLLLVPIGVASGALTIQQQSVISYGLMISVVITGFVIQYNYRIALAIQRLFRRNKPPKTDAAGPGGRPDEATGHGRGPEVLALGYFLNAEALATELKRTQPELLGRILVIDYNLDDHDRIREHSFEVSYGDISNLETLRHHGIQDAKVVLSTISDTFLRGITNEDLAAEIRRINPECKFIATADDAQTAARYDEAGIWRTISPPMKAAPAYAEALREALGLPDDRNGDH